MLPRWHRKGHPGRYAFLSVVVQILPALQGRIRPDLDPGTFDQNFASQASLDLTWSHDSRVLQCEC